MLGYSVENINEMIYGIESALCLINSDENPAITRYLDDAKDLLKGLVEEGRINV